VPAPSGQGPSPKGCEDNCRLLYVPATA
jgi:hypothetical protein